jgi:hypothetical protein
MSNLLNAASLVVTPNSYKEGKLYSVIPSDGSGDMSVVRATSATRVNAEGLIETASILGSELVTNGDFADGSANWGNYINGSSTIVFTDVATLNIDASNSNVGIYQENVFTSGKQYKIVLKMKASSSFDAEILETQQASIISTIGSVSLTTSYQNFTFYFTATGNNDIFIHRKFSAASANQSITIDNVSVKEVTTLNIPRIDYSLGGCPSILLEPQRTNLLLQSSSFDSGSWTKDALTVTANSIASPSGVMDADLLTYTGGNYRIFQMVTKAASALAYSTSVYVKKGTLTIFRLSLDSGSASQRADAFFDISLGVVSSTSVTGTFTNESATITDVGNGWYICTLSATTGTETNIRSTIYGSGAGTIYLWGAQLELGNYSTSYIPTTTASVTRNADIITRNNIYTNGLITAAGGTWFVELRNNISRTRDAVGGIWIGDNTTAGTLGNTLVFRSGGLGRLSIGKTIAGSFTSLFTTATDTCKIAIKWNGTTADIFENGVKVIAATAFTPTNLDFLVGNGTDVPKYINEMALFPTPLTDEQCSILTSDSYPTAAAAYASLGLVSESPSCLTSTTTF